MMIKETSTSVAQATVGEDTRVARHVVSKLPGASRSLLVIDRGSKLWVAKFLRNPQHRRVVINEYLGTRIAADLGLTVPDCTFIQIKPELLQAAQRAGSLSRSEAEAYEPGLAFGSAYAGVGHWRKTLDVLPGNDWGRVKNRSELAGMLVFDTWVQNTDRRQAVYVQEDRSRSLKAFWIDQGNCFAEANWRLNLHSPRCLCSDNPVYASLSGWEELEPWLARVHAFRSERIYEFISQLPSEWLEGEMPDLERLHSELDFRKKRLRTALLDLIHSRKRSFPAWPMNLRTSHTCGSLLALSSTAATGTMGAAQLCGI